MKQLKAIKKELKKQKLWKKYKAKFQHHQLHLLCSKVILVYNPNIVTSELLQAEIAYFKADPKAQFHMFNILAPIFRTCTKTKADWLSFAKYLFYVYQTASYYQDRWKKKSNIFDQNQQIKRNAEKRSLFLQWMNSLDVTLPNFNTKIIAVMKVVM